MDKKNKRRIQFYLNEEISFLVFLIKIILKIQRRLEAMEIIQ